MDSYLSYFFGGPYQILSTVSTFTVWFGLSLIGSVVAGRHAMRVATPFFGWAVITLLFTLGGVLTSLSFTTISIFIGILALGSFVYLWRAQQKFLDHGFIRLVVITIPLWILISGMQASQWDEFSHWLPSTLFLLEHDGFPDSVHSVTGASFPAYPYGWPILMYLAAAGVGTIGVVDDDIVDLSNLQRQVIHATDRIGMPKVKSAGEAVSAINPNVSFVPHGTRLTADNVRDLFSEYDIVADGSDNFDTRFLVNDACHLAGKTLVSGAILRFEGQIATFRSGRDDKKPCYRCLYRDKPPSGLVPSCAESGVLGALAGTVGSLQAVEVLKEILQLGDTLSGFLMIYDALAADFRKIKLPPRIDFLKFK